LIVAKKKKENIKQKAESSNDSHKKRKHPKNKKLQKKKIQHRKHATCGRP